MTFILVIMYFCTPFSFVYFTSLALVMALAEAEAQRSWACYSPKNTNLRISSCFQFQLVPLYPLDSQASKQ